MKNTFTDNVTPDNLIGLAGSLGDFSPSAVTFHTLPTVPSTVEDGALEVDRGPASAIFGYLRDDRPIAGPTPTAAARTQPQQPCVRHRPTSRRPRRRL